MERLIDSQRELHGRISRTTENLRKAGAAKLSVALVQSTLAALETKWAKVEKQHERLKAEFGDQLKKHEYLDEDFITEVEISYLQQRAALLEQEQALTGTDKRGAQTARKAESSTSSLPRIPMPSFSGKFEDWPAFRDLFASVVSEPTLAKVQKMHYLKTAVKGDAEQLIRNVPSKIMSAPGICSWGISKTSASSCAHIWPRSWPYRE